MNIGTSLFHSLSAQNLSEVGDRIGRLQEQVSSGKNDPRPSADPVRALRLSAAREQSEALDRFGANLTRAQSRLDQSDIVLGEATSVMQRVGELALRAASDTATPRERESIATETRALRDSLLGLANARDEAGQALFGGFRTQADPFRETSSGIVYQGDSGQPRLQVSESTQMPTGISGDEVFGDVPGPGGGDIFAMIDEFLAGLTAPAATADGGTGDAAGDAADGTASGAMLDRLQRATDHLIGQRTRVGALSANAERLGDVIDARALALDKAVAGLEDLDLAATLTRLQQNLLTRDAAQQTYARITQANLFDYLR